MGQGRGCDQTKKRPFLHKGACLYPAWQFKYYLLECETWSESERWGYVWLSYLGWCNQCFVISFGGTQTVCVCSCLGLWARPCCEVPVLTVRDISWLGSLMFFNFIHILAAQKFFSSSHLQFNVMQISCDF